MSESEKNFKLKITLSEIISVLYIPITIVFLEVALRIKAGTAVFENFVPLLFFSLCFGVILDICVFSVSNRKARKIIIGAVLFILCLYFLLEAFVNQSYQVYMAVDSIAQGTGGVFTDFKSTLARILRTGFFTILSIFLPFLAYIAAAIGRIDFYVSRGNIKIVIIALVSFAAIFFACGEIIVRTDSVMAGIYRDAYNFDNSIRSFGLVTGTRLDIQYRIFGNNTDDDFIIEEPEIIIKPIIPEGADNTDEEEPVKEYGYNVLDIDFDKIISATSDNSLLNVHKYVSSLSGTRQNDYTGLFKGKNLILIAAESFAKEVIDPELTPTLYRLYENGFTFTDYYQPTWGGSTSSGEFSIFTGLIPTAGVTSIHKLVEGNTDFTIGNKLMAEGYFSASYHNGTYDYYSRHLTHTKLGYSTFKAFGNGLEEGVNTSVWPASDLEMIEYTLTDYIDKQPFSVYYMTVSGHGFYTDFNQAMSSKNRSFVEDLDCSTTIKSYIAANLELEFALEYLVGELEKAGIADDTVIVLTGDHYPYALEKGDSWGNDEDYLAELYGYTYTNNMERDHNALIIWSGCLENKYSDMAIEINDPTYSLDILPTLCNLFGVPFDSRLFAGRDVFSDAEAIVIWPEYNWKTKLGYYDYTRQKFIPSEEGLTADENYINTINNTVKNRIAFSKAVLNYDYFALISE